MTLSNEAAEPRSESKIHRIVWGPQKSFELLRSAEKVNEIQPVRGRAPAPAPAKSLTPRPGSLALPGKALPPAGGTALKLVKAL